MAKKILIIEDNQDSFVILNDLLTQEGYEIMGAATGREGLVKIETNHPDLVLLDTCLPDVDGIEICRRIKREKKLPVKIIVYTAVIDAIDAARAREMGADSYCVKGSDTSNLIETVKQLLAT